MDILFGQSYYLRFDPKLWHAMQPFPPLGTLYAAAYLRERGYRVAVFDAMLAETEDEWDCALELHRPRLAVIYEDNFNYLSKMCLGRMRQAALAMIGMARRRGCTIIVAGADAGDHIDLYLAAGADYVLIGEGEETLSELVDCLYGRGQSELMQIRGLAWLQDGALVQTPPRPDLHDLDRLPFPAWDLVQVDRYRQIWRERHHSFAINMVTTRGCPFHCNWCAKPIWGQRYHSRSPENVVLEMKWLQERYQPDFISFVDDIFGLKPGWTRRFGQCLAAAGIKIPFKCLSRADLILRDGEVEALKQAGAQIVWLGAESGAQHILDAMEKGTRVEQIDAAAERLHAAGIQVGFFLQFGYPGETAADIEQTLELVRRARPDDIGISVSYPLPGTTFHAAVREQLGLQHNWYDSDDLAMLYEGPYTTEFYRQLHTVVHLEFRRGKAWRTAIHGRPEPLAAAASRGRRLMALVKIPLLALRLPAARWKLGRLADAPRKVVRLAPPAPSTIDPSRPSPQELMEVRRQ